MRTAIFTLAIGEDYRDLWHGCCRPNWQAYADRHGIDLHCIDAPLDDSPRGRGRNPAWQKLLVWQTPEARAYDLIAVIDLDILINAAAPDIFAGCTPDRVHLCEATEAIMARTPLLKGAHAVLNAHYDRIVPGRHDGPTFWERAGLSSDGTIAFNTGVIVADPNRFAPFFRDVYDRYQGLADKTFNYEQNYLNYELCRQGLHAPLDPRFNQSFIDLASGLCGLWDFDRPYAGGLTRAALGLLESAYFLHFAGSIGLLPHTVRWQNADSGGRLALILEDVEKTMAEVASRAPADRPVT